MRRKTRDRKAGRLDNHLFVNTCKEKIGVESVRIRDLVESINARGFIVTPEDPVECDVIYRGSSYRWQTRRGSHRVAVMSSPYATEMPVFVKKIIRREDVKSWPHVRSGLYGEEAALKVFDRIFDATPPPVYAPILQPQRFEYKASA